jgi:thiamine kinase-like enzyme
MGKDLVPDSTILFAIFPNKSPISVDVMSNNWTTCTFKASFLAAPGPDLPLSFVIRMETTADKLAAVKALEDLARMYIPDLIPKSYGVGKGTTENGLDVEFSISEFVGNTESLEDIWTELDDKQRRALMSQIGSVIHMLHNPKSRDDAISRGISVKSTRDLLISFVAKNQLKSLSTSSLSEAPDGITITSSLSAYTPVFLSNQDLWELDNSAVLCHNDFEPRNILVRHDKFSNTYTLAAIIDWEFSLVAPFAFETALKDTVLGGSNLHYDWYIDFKYAARHLVSNRRQKHETDKLITAIQLVADSKRVQWRKNVSAVFQTRWMEREGLAMSKDVTMGWEKDLDSGAKVWKFSKEANEELEMQVLKDLGYAD